MPQDVAQILRDHLYAALESYIDWDAERLERGSFMQRTGAASIPFRSRSIVFLRQQTVESASIVKLKLPMDPSEGNDQLRTAIALSALWQFNSTKSWDFPDAFEGLVALGECLAQWSAALLAQFKHMPGSESGWDAVDTAVEALAVGAALAGKMSSSRLTLTEKLNVIFEPLPDRLHELAIKEWEKLYYDIRTHADKYQALIRAWASATKGGRVGAMINPQLVLPPLKRILRGWQVSSSSPREADGLRDPYRQLARVHAAIRTRLPEVTRAEYERRMDWLGAIRQHMDENTLRMQVAEAARRMGQAISDEAIAVRPSIRREFDEALVQFAAANQLDNAVRAAQQLHDLPDPTTQLEALFPGRGAPALIIATRFFGAADALIREAEAAIETKRTSLDAEVNEGFRRDHQIIVESLETIQHALNVIGGEA